MLAIEIEFLTGRYVATAYNSRRDPEWPPEPARLFSALVATLFGNEASSPEELAVLGWLETLDAPEILASPASTREVATVFVPVNDVALTDVDAEADALEELRQVLAAAEAGGASKVIKKAATAVTKADNKLRAAIDRQTAVPKGTANPASGRSVLPEYRLRQPRTFPSVTPFEPRVAYVWADAVPSESQQAALDGLLARLFRLGHSSSLIAARLLEEMPNSATVGDETREHWRPSSSGEKTLRVVQAGQLAALERGFALHRETEPRVMPARFQAYTCRPPDSRATLAQSLFGEDWLVLRRIGGLSPTLVATARVARVVRKALMAHAPQPISEILSGHTSDGQPSERDHLAVVPLPFVGHERATGSVLGVALILPRTASEAQRREIYQALAAWEQSVRLEDEDNPSLPLHMGPGGGMELERVEWGTVQASLRPSTWCTAALVWHSATPVALDRNPGDLRSRDPARLAIAVAEATATIRAACVRVGVPEPEDITILPAAPLAGATKASQFPPFPQEANKTRRVLTHVRLRFREPVKGPLLLGAGRYFGLGLMRPERSRG